ncbi:hypothetical protein ACWD5F_22520 [Streptomyces sp. NPDC002499]
MPPSESSGHIPQWVYDLGSFRSFQDAVKNVVWDVKAHPDNVPVTGAKAEVAGVKAEANAASLSVFGVQTEYSLVKHEATAIDLNKILEGGVQKRLDEEQDRRLHDLSLRAVTTKDLVDTVKRNLASATADIRRLQADEQQLRTTLRNEFVSIRQKLANDDQRLRAQLVSLGTKISSVRQVANAADQRSKALRTKANSADRQAQTALRQIRVLDREVKDGMQKVRELEGSARGAGRSIQGLRNDLNSLEQTLRR